MASLIPGETQAGDDHVRVVSEAESVKAIRGTEFPARHERRFVIARDDGPVDRAFHAVAFHRNRDLLGYGFSGAGGLIHRRARRTAPVHLERKGSESAYDEIPVAIRCTVEVALLGSSQLVAGDHDAVRVRMAVQVHVFRLLERRLDRVVAGRFVGGVPIGHRRTGSDMEPTTLLRELCVIQRLSGSFLVCIDLAGPSRGRDAASFHLTGGLGLSLSKSDGSRKYSSNKG